MNSHSHKSTLIAFAVLANATAAFSQSAWLPVANEFKVTPGFSYSTFDEFWMGDTKVSNPPNGKRLNQYTGYLSLEYGILGNLAADATIGYSATDTDAFGGDSDSGLSDTSLGLRYRLVDETQTTCPFAPTLALRAGAVIPGTYDSNLPFSAGDGAHAFEGSLLVGKAFGQTGLGMYGDIGYRVREHPVPDEWFGTGGLFYQIGPVTLAAGYRHVQGVSGLDIGGSGFDPGAGRSSGFPALREINQIFEAGISVTDNGGRTYQLTFGRSIDGRNTGDKSLVGVNATFPFGGR
jgi:hypothetical protein